MVLDRSDYSLSNLYRGNWDPTNPTSFVTKAAGTLVAASVAIFVLVLANDRGVPMINALLTRVGLGAATTDGGVEVF